MMISHLRSGFIGAAAALAAALLGCGSDEQNGSGPGDDVGEVSFELTTAPTGVLCIRLTSSPASGGTSTKTFTVSSGSSTANLTWQVPQGTTTFTGDAFDVACTSLNGVSPSWTSDGAPATVRPGVVTTVPLTFRKNSAVVVSGNFARSIRSVSGGYSSTFATTDTGPLQWGALPQTKLPAAVPVLTDAQVVVGGGAHACALRNNGTVWCWGQNTNGQVGPGIPIGATTTNPVQVTGLGTASLLTAGAGFNCAYVPGPMNQGIYCWGANWAGQLGNNSTVDSPTPVMVASSSGNWKAIAAGSSHMLALHSISQVYSWGNNTDGQLGIFSSGGSIPFMLNVGLQGTVAITAGDSHSCSLAADGQAYCWGANWAGQVGDGTTGPRNSPVAVTSALGPFKQIDAGGGSNCGVLTDGRLACWGENFYGALGDKTTIQRLVPTINAMMPDPGMTVSVGQGHACALTSALDIYCWGMNGSGQVGDGTVNTIFSPIKVTLP